MQIPNQEIKSRKEIGKLKGQPVYLLSTVGGLKLVASTQKGKTSILGAGGHQAIAKHLAEKNEPDIQFTDLAKSLDYPIESYQHLLPEAEALTEALRKAQE